ncbi:hypothetical protein BpHYR1_006146 [Brachionus plicatilis]|uniref:Uncharacterized protein n=1 Tax=Brachionus plicatilis TaxID=10195 RepID=A0A3M7RVM3_BRAPC|nr:hypothetical protein BpHYR1_006146 [Brachionus plicatilis]
MNNYANKLKKIKWFECNKKRVENTKKRLISQMNKSILFSKLEIFHKCGEFQIQIKRKFVNKKYFKKSNKKKKIFGNNGAIKYFSLIKEH